MEDIFHENRFNLLCLVICVFLFAVLLWSAHAVYVLGDVAVYDENGPLENLQAFLLAISCILFLVPVVMQKNSEKLLLTFCSLLCYGFVLRELDVERFDVPEVVKFIGSGIGRNISLIVGFTIIVIYAGFRFSYYKRAGILFLKSRPGILLMTGGLLLVIGDLFEKRHFIHHAFLKSFLSCLAMFPFYCQQSQPTAKEHYQPENQTGKQVSLRKNLPRPDLWQ